MRRISLSILSWFALLPLGACGGLDSRNGLDDLVPALASVATLQEAFNHDVGKARLIVLLDPG